MVWIKYIMWRKYIYPWLSLKISVELFHWEQAFLALATPKRLIKLLQGLTLLAPSLPVPVWSRSILLLALWISTKTWVVSEFSEGGKLDILFLLGDKSSAEELVGATMSRLFTEQRLFPFFSLRLLAVVLSQLRPSIKSVPSGSNSGNAQLVLFKSKSVR